MLRTVTILILFVLTSVSAAQTTRPTAATTRPAPPRTGPGASGVEVAILSVKTEHLLLRRPLGDGKFDDLTSNAPLLVVRLKVTNAGQKDVTYNSFNGTPTGRGDDRASLFDSARKFAALVGFGELEVPDAVKAATPLKPGDSVEDVLAFAPPADGAKPALLYLPAKNHGDTGMWKLPIPSAE